MPVLDLQALLGRVRKTSVPSYSDNQEVVPQVNDRGELLTSIALPPKAELVRLGRTITRTIPTGSAFTHVAAWPTTRAELVVQNGEAAGGKSYVFDSAWAVNCATSISAASAYTLLGQVVNTGSAVTDNAAVLTTNRAGHGNYTSLSKCAVANTSYGVASKWEVLAAAPAGPAASIGLAVYAELFGGIVLPPGAILLLNLIAGTATGTAIIGATWHELQLPIA